MARSKINSDHPTLLTTNQRNDDDARTYAYRHDRGDSLCLADTLSRTLHTNRKSAILASPGPPTARRSTSLHLVYRAPEHSDIGINLKALMSIGVADTTESPATQGNTLCTACTRPHHSHCAGAQQEQSMCATQSINGTSATPSADVHKTICSAENVSHDRRRCAQ